MHDPQYYKEQKEKLFARQIELHAATLQRMMDVLGQFTDEQEKLRKDVADLEAKETTSQLLSK